LLTLRRLQGIFPESDQGAAKRVGAKLYATFRFLAKNPRVGTNCGDIRPGLKVFMPQAPASQYLVFFRYRDDEDAVLIDAVIDGSRDWVSILMEEPT
jgi:plasmid stabilization system protein ParE